VKTEATGVNATPISDRLEQLLRDCVSSQGFDLEEVGLTPAGKHRVLRVAVDQDGGVTLDEVADVTRAISTALDSSDEMGAQSYTLEVGSRGTSKPLTEPRHWRRNAGRLVKVKTADGETFEGRIATSDDEAVAIGTEAGERRLPYADVRKARVQVELNRKDT